VNEASVAPAKRSGMTPRWGLGDAIGGWVIVQVVALFWGVGVLSVSGHAGQPFDDLPLSVVALVQLGLALGFFAVPYAVTRWKGNGLVVDLGLRVVGRDLWQGGLAGVLLQVVAVPLLYWPVLHLLDKTPSDLEGPAQSLTERANGAVGVVLLVVIVGVLAPIFEEIFFRGLVQRAVLKRGLPPVAAIGITAVAFGATHFELLQLPGLVLAGALFGFLAHRSGRLGPAIAAHMGFNMVTVVALTLA
jgi:membrane protease YdiL (CAAX protease family)